MRQQSEQLTTLEKDALFNLLPYAIRTYDNGALKLLFRAVTDQHNFFIQKFRELIRLQSPYKAGKFKPEDFWESPAVYAEYFSLVNRWSSLTAGQKSYAETLKARIPNSLRAKEFEAKVLTALATNVGERTYGGKLNFSLREFIASAISRHQIKGSHSSVNALGLTSGLFEIMVQELWSRFSIREPGNPMSLRNIQDFSYTPEDYPRFSNTQVAAGSLNYDPTVLDDAEQPYSETFRWCTSDRSSPYWYNKVINDRNPIGNFTEPVVSKLISGVYQLRGGGSNRAFVRVPSLSGRVYTFEAVGYGAWANSAKLIISNNRNGTQNLLLEGPMSRIKFKSSYFDLTIAADISSYPLFYPSVPVIRIDASSYLDNELGRVPADYPVTTVRDGSSYDFVISDPATHFQVDNQQLRDLFNIVREMFEGIRPITRSTRFEKFGFLVKDQFQYAPLLTVNQVVLQSSNGLYWSLNPSVDGVSWVESEGPANEFPVVQYDRVRNRYYRWSVSDQGTTALVSTLPSDETVVYFRSESFTGFVFVDSGILQTSVIPPTLLTDTIHTDGTDDEQLIGAELANVVENPIPGVEQYMSEDAVSEDVPSERLLFQTSPEDSTRIRPIAADFSPFHVDAHFGTEEDAGFSGSNWSYTRSGQLVSSDIRLRSAGIGPGFLEPPPTGDQTRQDGLRYNYPVQFLNYHNLVSWRDRVGNEPKYSQYTYDAPDQFTGATRVDASLEDHDGPIEGGASVSVGSSEVIPSVGDGVTPNGQIPATEIDSLILNRFVRQTQACYRYRSIMDSDGLALATTSAVHTLQKGSKLYIASGPYAGFHEVMEKVDELRVKLNTAFVSEVSGGILHCKATDTHVIGAQDITVTVSRVSNESPISLITTLKPLDLSSEVIIDVTSSTDLEFTRQISVSGSGIVTVYASTAGVDALTLELPDNVPDLPGELMWAGGQRSAPEITLLADGQHFYDHDETGIYPYAPINGNKWWRGGTWRGSALYSVETTGRDGLPGLLISDTENLPESYYRSSTGEVYVSPDGQEYYQAP